MLNRKIINEDEPLKQNISNINNIKDPNISIQSNLDFISDRPMTEFSHLNNINNEIIKEEKKIEPELKNEEEEENQMQLKVYFSFKNFPIIVVGPRCKTYLK